MAKGKKGPGAPNGDKPRVVKADGAAKLGKKPSGAGRPSGAGGNKLNLGYELKGGKPVPTVFKPPPPKLNLGYTLPANKTGAGRGGKPKIKLNAGRVVRKIGSK